MKKETKITLTIFAILSVVISGMWLYMTGRIDDAVKKIGSAKKGKETDTTEEDNNRYNGIIPATLEHASFPLSRGSKTRPYGTKGIEVKKLQEYLNFLDWFNKGKHEGGFIDTDGKFGKDTLSLIMKYNLPKEISSDYYDKVVLLNLDRAEKQYKRKFEK